MKENQNIWKKNNGTEILIEMKNSVNSIKLEVDRRTQKTNENFQQKIRKKQLNLIHSKIYLKEKKNENKILNLIYLFKLIFWKLMFWKA